MKKIISAIYFTLSLTGLLTIVTDNVLIVLLLAVNFAIASLWVTNILKKQKHERNS